MNINVKPGPPVRKDMLPDQQSRDAQNSHQNGSLATPAKNIAVVKVPSELATSVVVEATPTANVAPPFESYAAPVPSCPPTKEVMSPSVEAVLPEEGVAQNHQAMSPSNTYPPNMGMMPGQGQMGNIAMQHEMVPGMGQVPNMSHLPNYGMMQMGPNQGMMQMGPYQGMMPPFMPPFGGAGMYKTDINPLPHNDHFWHS